MNTDLDTALAFVTRRIEQEATESGTPLNEYERSLLHHLPTESTLPTWFDPENPEFIPRDRPYEKLCATAKNARLRDLREDPENSADWEFAIAVAKLNRHPMSWLLQWAGAKIKRPWWDQWLLFSVGLLPVMSILTLFVLAGDRPWSRIRWDAILFAYVAIFVFMYYVLRRMEDWQLRWQIERCRRTRSLFSI